MTKGKAKEAILDIDGVLRIGSQICVPKVGDLIKLILEDSYCSWIFYSHGAAKMYHDLS